jgi:hypothetical protein
MPSIAIAAVTIPNWSGNTSGISLRVYNNQNFLAQSGTLYPATVQNNLKAAGLGTFFQSFACTVASGALTIPALALDSTADSPDNPAATYSAVFWDGASGQPIQPFGSAAAFSLSPAPTSTTWAAIFTAAEDE